MALSDYVTLSITQATANLTRAGLGIAMHLSYTPTWSERSRTYNSYTGVIADFPITTGPEARSALAYFSQNPQPSALIIGRGANKPTKTVQLSALNPTTNLTYTYKVNVKGTGFADTTVSFTSDGTPTDAEYAAGMVTALNAVASKNYTAAGATSPITITGNAVGNWFSIEVCDVAYQTTTETTADPGVAADIAAVLAENPSWYALQTAFNSKAYGVACAAVIEATGSKIYVAASNDTSTVLVATTGTADLADQCKTNAYGRTSVHYHRDPSAFFDAGLLGVCLPFDPGTETWAFKTVAGVGTFPMTATHRANITARNANSYENVAGLNISFNGMLGSAQFIDFRRASDALQDDMSKAVFAALAANPKLPYTDTGIAVIKSVMTGSLMRFSRPGGFLVPNFTVSVPKAANVSSADKAARVLNNCTFAATSQGAVHKDNITGSISA
jgi:hypothetical protein